MNENLSLTMYSVYADYEKYVSECKNNGTKAVPFFKYAFGQF